MYKIKHYICLLSLCSLCFSPKIKSQDLAFSQYIYTPFLTNPALLSNTDQINFAFNYRHQPLASGDDISTFMGSAIYPFLKKDTRKTWGAIGLSLINDQAANFITTNGGILGLSYLYHLGENQLSIGLQGGFFNQNFDISRITTDNQFLNNTFEGITNEVFDNTNVSFPVISTGIFWKRTDGSHLGKYFVGFALYNINQPQNSFLDMQNSKLPLNTSIIGGVKVFERELLSITPSFRWINRAGFNQVQVGSWLDFNINSIGTLIKKGQIRLGAWYHSNDAINMTLAIQQPKYNLSFNYDLPISSNTTVWLGSGAVEFSLGFNIKKREKKREEIKDKPITPFIAKIEYEPIKPKQVNPKIEEPSLPKKIQEAKADTIITYKGKSKDTLLISVVTKNKKDTLLVSVVPKSKFKLTPSEKELFQKTILFSYNKGKLDDETINSLNGIADVLKRKTILKLEIVGHTCNLGNSEKNRILSKHRADDVRDYLIEKEVKPRQITTIGEGSTRPAYPNTSDVNRSLNRRVEFRVLFN